MTHNSKTISIIFGKNTFQGHEHKVPAGLCIGSTNPWTHFLLNHDSPAFSGKIFESERSSSIDFGLQCYVGLQDAVEQFKSKQQVHPKNDDSHFVPDILIEPEDKMGFQQGSKNTHKIFTRLDM